MRYLAWFAAVLVSAGVCLAQAPASEEAAGFARIVIASLLSDQPSLSFAVADKVFTLDNGEVLSREDLAAAWPRLAREALKRKVTVEEFLRAVDLSLSDPGENKRLRSDKRVMAAYQPRSGDVYCDASRVKSGVDNFIAYDKAFIFLIRKVDGRWMLIGIGG